MTAKPVRSRRATSEAPRCSRRPYPAPNEYRTRIAIEEDMVEFERRYWKYHDLPQPSIVDMVLDVALHPRERRAETRGRFLLRNLTSQHQVLQFVSDKKPAYAGVDPYNFYVDRNSGDNVAAVR